MGNNNSITHLDEQVRSVALNHLQAFFRKHRNDWSKRDIQKLVIELRKSYLAIKQLNISTASTKRVLEAIYAHFFYGILFRRNHAVDDEESDTKKNNYENLSIDQLTHIENNVIIKFSQLTAEEQNGTIKPDWVGYLVAAALYSKNHNRQAELDQFTSMVKFHESTGECYVDLGNAEVVRRLDKFKRVGGIQELHAEPLEEGNQVAMEDSDAAQLSAKIINAAQVTRNSLLNFLDNKQNLDDEDKEFVNLKIEQLSSIERAIRPRRVAVVGSMSAGKSSFLSALLEETKLLRTGAGAVTKTLTELQHADQGDFTATLTLATVDDVKDWLDLVSGKKATEGRGKSDDDADEIFAYLALYHLFDQVDEHLEDSSRIPLSPKAPAYLIGRQPIVFRNASLGMLSSVLNKNLEDNKETYKYILQSIRITGPFQHLPAGVILVDTPGLDDADQINSHHTLNELHKFDDVWYANEYSTAMGKDTDQQVIRMILSLSKGPSTRLHIIATKADREEDRSEATRKELMDNIYLTFCRHILGNSGSGNRDWIHKKMTEQPIEVQTEVLQKVQRVSVNFVSVRPPNGLEHWRDRLQTLSQEYKEKLQIQQKLLQQLKSTPVLDGGVQSRTAERQIGTRWKLAKSQLLESLNLVNKDKICSELAKVWSGITPVTTIRTIMNLNQGGVYKKKIHQSFQIYDLNFNIAEFWIHSGGIEAAWDSFMKVVDEIRVVAVSINSKNMQADRFADEVRALGKHCFELDVKDKIQSILRAQNVYRLQRDTLPSKQELQHLLSKLIDHARQFVSRAENLFSNLNNALLSFQGTKNAEVQYILNSWNHVKITIPPIEFLSELNKEVMIQPVLTECCDRYIDKLDLEPAQRQSCSFCGNAKCSVYADKSLQFNINRWLQDYHYKAPKQQWWLHLEEHVKRIGPNRPITLERRKPSRRIEDSGEEESHLTKKVRIDMENVVLLSSLNVSEALDLLIHFGCCRDLQQRVKDVGEDIDGAYLSCIDGIDVLQALENNNTAVRRPRLRSVLEKLHNVRRNGVPKELLETIRDKSN